jgi:hypothetical protein
MAQGKLLEPKVSRQIKRLERFELFERLNRIQWRAHNR